MAPPLALLHGFTGGPSNFEPIVAAFGESSPIVAPALLGHGGPNDAATTFEGEIDRIAALFRSAAPEWQLVGYSLGGRLALGLLVRHPDLFSAAVLIGAQPGLASDEDRVRRRIDDGRFRKILEDEGIEAFVRAWEALPLFATQRRLDGTIRSRQRAERLRHDPRGLSRSLEATGLGEMPSYWDELDAIRIPTALVAGKLDEKFSALALLMADSMPNATTVFVEDSGHNVLLERPAALIEILSECFDGLSGDRR